MSTVVVVRPRARHWQSCWPAKGRVRQLSSSPRVRPETSLYGARAPIIRKRFESRWARKEPQLLWGRLSSVWSRPTFAERSKVPRSERFRKGCPRFLNRHRWKDRHTKQHCVRQWQQKLSSTRVIMGFEIGFKCVQGYYMYVIDTHPKAAKIILIILTTLYCSDMFN